MRTFAKLAEKLPGAEGVQKKEKKKRRERMKVSTLSQELITKGEGTMWTIDCSKAKPMERYRPHIKIRQLRRFKGEMGSNEKIHANTCFDQVFDDACGWQRDNNNEESCNTKKNNLYHKDHSELLKRVWEI